jgi:hypothetical protein
MGGVVSIDLRIIKACDTPIPYRRGDLALVSCAGAALRCPSVSSVAASQGGLFQPRCRDTLKLFQSDPERPCRSCSHSETASGCPGGPVSLPCPRSGSRSPVVDCRTVEARFCVRPSFCRELFSGSWPQLRWLHQGGVAPSEPLVCHAARERLFLSRCPPCRHAHNGGLGQLRRSSCRHCAHGDTVGGPESLPRQGS